MLDNAPCAAVQHPRDIDNVGASEAGEESSSDSDLDNEIPIQELPDPMVVTHRGNDTVSWDLISNFSLEALELKYKTHARVTWHVLSSFAEWARRRNTVHAVQRINRPTNIVHPFLVRPVKLGWSLHLHYLQVITSIMSELTFARNSWTNLFPLARGICLFAMKAHHSLYRIGS